MHSQIQLRIIVDSCGVRDSIPRVLNLLGGENAEKEPVPDCSLSRREAGAGTYLAEIYGTVLSSGPSQSRVACRAGTRQQDHRLKLNVPRQVVSRWRKRFFDLRLLGLQDRARRGRPSVFPPDIVVKIKALACELPRESGLPLSRYSNCEIAAEAIRRASSPRSATPPSGGGSSRTPFVPWQLRSWIFPRDPRFEQKAGPVLDLYQGLWRGVPLHPDELVICADEKPSIQARQRTHVPRSPRPREAMRVEHEYERRGALCYFAAWDVRHAKLFGHCAPTSGIAPFNQLVHKVMDHDPYRSAPRVFWVVDNGSSHRGRASIERLQRQWPNIEVVHPAYPCKLAEPDRDLLLHRPAQGAHSE